MTSTLRSRRAAFGLVLTLAGLTLAGCGSSGTTNAESNPTTTAAAVTTTTAKVGETTTTAAPAGGETSTTKASGAALTVTPTENLAAGQVVQVSGAGFTPGKTLALAECTADSKGPADCNSAAASWPKVGADGTFTSTVKIVIGPIGTSGHVCNASTPCSIGTTDITDPTGPNLSRVKVTFAA